MPRTIVVIAGSESDLPQCETGLNYLKEQEDKGLVKVLAVHVASIHRNTHDVLRLLQELSEKADVLIVGAGWANALTGFCDAYLRNKLKDNKLVVVGVAFMDGGHLTHNTAAMHGISEVPGTQVVFGPFNGSAGFLKACKFAAEETLPQIVLKESKPSVERTLGEAIAYINERKTACPKTA